MARATRRYLAFLHRFEQSGLRLGGRAIDFVGQNDVCENRAREEFESSPA
jgi:hypothetical protein